MAFSYAALTYIIALIIDALLIFSAIFHVIAFDELKTDYKNPIDQCNNLNPLVLPEYLVHLFFNILFLTAGEWFSLCLNIPLIAYHFHRPLPYAVPELEPPDFQPRIQKKFHLRLSQIQYRTRPVMSGPGLYDPTSIMNADVLNRCQKEGWIKLAFYLLSFFYYLYGMIYSLISN